ncbi:ABC transporter substrate-binding protein [Anaerocolumna xylanovorans]|uniref:Putative aldouronate transport system substrate-binding protein n=1 Tax=Anaerocolumna xylanovorans DSM 12503 TaxID=1121345 RepID=A0A1M7YJ97_9FIRM|nr:extracellular solute-binding protein [Anaerocolumna xylanovorans]SHO52676.1 putative aldouronate transport system substrate-binding protein [Anaerocolumna xylanovorans DSM 12503]
MRKQKLLAIVLMLTMSMGLLGACSKNNNSGQTSNETKTEANADKGTKDTSSEKPSTLTILYPGDESDRMTDFLENEFAEKMATDLNMKVKMIYVPWDSYWDQKDIMLAANEPIDLYWDGLPNLSQIVNEKQAMPLDDLISKYGQDINKVIPETHIEGAKVNGQIYGIPSSYASSSGMYQFVTVRQDLMDEVGMTDLNTPDDLKEYATKVKEKHPELKGPGDIIFKPLTRFYQPEQYTFVAKEETAVYGEDTGKVYSYYETDAFKDVAKFNRDMYTSELYKDELSTNYNERTNRMQTGLYIWTEGSFGKDTEISSGVKANAPDAKLKNYLLADDKPRYITATGGEALCIPNTAPNPEGAMKFINWIYSSQANYLFALYGVEGKDYEMADGRINRLVTNDFFYEWMFRNKNYTVFTPDVDQAYIDDYQHWDDDAKLSNAIGFVFNNENVKEIETAVYEVCQKDLAPIRNGFVDFDSNYDAAIKKLKDAGIDKYIAEVQKQFDEFTANKNK